MPAPFEKRPCRLADPLLETRLNGLAPHQQGKVRDIYDLGDTLLIVATDRISAFDYVLGSGIPDKGKVLTQLSAFWFDRTRHIVPNHLIETDVRTFPATLRPFDDLLARPIDAGAEDEAGADRVRGARLPVGLGLEGIPGDRRGLRRRAAGRPARVGPAAGADLHAGDQGSDRARHQHQRGGGRRARRRGARRDSCAT